MILYWFGTWGSSWKDSEFILCKFLIYTPIQLCLRSLGDWINIRAKDWPWTFVLHSPNDSLFKWRCFSVWIQGSNKQEQNGIIVSTLNGQFSSNLGSPKVKPVVQQWPLLGMVERVASCAYANFGILVVPNSDKG